MARKNGAHTSTAVMQRRRAAEDVDGLSEEERLWKTLDFFATPPWAARAVCEHAAKLWGPWQPEHMIEPAAGRGHFAMPATEFFPVVDGSDVHDHRAGYAVRDWLDDDAWPEGPCCDIVATNPPFEIAEEFVRRGLRRSRLGVCLLLRISFLEGGERHAIMNGPDVQLTQVVVFSERVPMTLGEWDPKAASATSYAAFFWSHKHDPLPTAWFGPGTRERLWLPDDVKRFGKRVPMPLFPDFDVV